MPLVNEEATWYQENHQKNKLLGALYLKYSWEVKTKGIAYYSADCAWAN